MSVRKGARRLEIPNDGHCAFLYDEAHRQRLYEMKAAEVITGLDNALDREERLATLAGEGLVLAYELYQDDALTVEVAVGKPLTPKEKRGLRWLKVQKGCLSLPSGRLCVESWNTQRITGEPPDAEGAIVEIPPGDYVVSLQRVDPGDDTDEDAAGDVIILTPKDQTRVPRRKDPMLSWAEAAGAPPLRLPTARIDGGAFRGSCFGGAFGTQSDMKRRHVETLGLSHGGSLRWETAGGATEALYLARMSTNMVTVLYGNTVRPDRVANLVYDDRLRAEAVALRTFDSEIPGPAEPTPLTISDADTRVLPAVDPAHLAPVVEETQLSGKVFLATERAWGIPVSWHDVEAAGMTPKSAASLEIDGRKHIVYPGLSPHAHADVVEAAARLNKTRAKQLAKLKAARDAIEEESWDAEPDQRPAIETRLREQRQRIDALLFPEDKRHEAPLWGMFTPYWEGDDDRQILLVLPMVGDAVPQGVDAGAPFLLTRSR